MGFLVLLAALVLGDVIATETQYQLARRPLLGEIIDIHVLGETVEVLALLIELLPEREELLLLAQADGVVLVGLLAALEGVTTVEKQSTVSIDQS